MAKSLTEIAKQVLRESNDPTPDRNAQTRTPNATTLRPASTAVEAPFATPGSTPPNPGEVEDLGSAIVDASQNLPDATRPIVTGNKRPADTKSAGEQSAPASMMEEDFEISEELESFIDQLVSEGKSEAEIIKAIDENFEFVDEDTTPITETKIDMSEHVNALLAGETLSEAFKAKATTIFESAVTAKVNEEVAMIEAAAVDAIAEEVNKVKAEMTEHIDNYLNYVVEQWVSDNEVAIEAGLKTELTEDFISGLRNLFAENYIDIPDSKVNVLEELSTKVMETEDKLNEEIERNANLTKLLAESRRDVVLRDIVEGLTATQADKIRTLAEGVEFSTEDLFATKIRILRENYFPDTVANPASVIDREEQVADGRSLINENTGPMAQYVRALGRHLPT